MKSVLFLELKAPSAVVIHHVYAASFRVEGTRRRRVQAERRSNGLRSSKTTRFADRIRHIAEPANEQNLKPAQAVPLARNHEVTHEDPTKPLCAMALNLTLLLLRLRSSFAQHSLKVSSRYYEGEAWKL
jgi:hypothetical protein